MLKMFHTPLVPIAAKRQPGFSIMGGGEEENFQARSYDYAKRMP